MATKVYTKTKTATNTGITVALAFLAVSAAFAAAAFTMNQKYSQKMMPQSSPSKPAMDGSKPKAEMPTREKSANLLTAALSHYEDYPSALVVAPSANVRMLQVVFDAQGESFMIRKIRLMNVANPIVNPLGSTDGAIAHQLKVTYRKQDGTFATTNAVLTGGIADISGMEMIVPQNSTVPLTVSADFTDPNSGRTYSRVLTPRIGIDFGVPGDTNFEAVGMTTGRSLTTASDLAIVDLVGSPLPKQPDILGNLMYAVKSKPTVTLAANSPSGAYDQTSGEVLRFTVSADAMGSLELSRLTFKINSTDNANSGWNRLAGAGYNLDSCRITNGQRCREYRPNGLDASDFVLYDVADPGVPLNGLWAMFNTEGTFYLGNPPPVTGYARFDLYSPNLTIAAGSSKTFIVKVSLTGASREQHDTFRMDVLGDSPEQFINSNYNYNNGGTTYNGIGPRFVWGETGVKAVPAFPAPSDANSTGLTGYLVRNLDVIGGTLVY